MSTVASPTTLDSKCPGGPMAERWDKHRFDMKLVNPGQQADSTT